MREEAIVVAARAPLARVNSGDAERARLPCEDFAQIHSRRLRDRATGNAFVHVRTHFVASAADRRAQRQVQLPRRDALAAQRVDTRLEYARGGPAPAR